VSSKSSTWHNKIQAWKKAHNTRKVPKYFQIHIRILGLMCRMTGALLMRPLPLKLVPPIPDEIT
jgi:hypothetical protein